MATSTTAPASQMLFNGASLTKLTPTVGQNGRGSALAQQHPGGAAQAAATSATTATASAASPEATPAKTTKPAATASASASDKRSAPAKASSTTASKEANLYTVPVHFHISSEQIASGKPATYTIPVRDYYPELPASTKFLMRAMTVSAEMPGNASIGVAIGSLGGTRTVSLANNVSGAPFHVEVQRLDGRSLKPVTVVGYAQDVNTDHFTRYGHVLSEDALKEEGIQFVTAAKKHYVDPHSPIGRVMRTNNAYNAQDGSYKYYNPHSDIVKTGGNMVDPTTGKKEPAYVITLPEDTPHIDSVATSINKKVLQSEAFTHANQTPEVALKVVNILKANDPSTLAGLPNVTVRGTADMYAFNIPERP